MIGLIIGAVAVVILVVRVICPGWHIRDLFNRELDAMKYKSPGA